MKKSIAIVLLTVLVFTIVGCAEKDNNLTSSGEISGEGTKINARGEENTEDNMIYFPAENMNVFRTIQIISLNENPTTGYSWSYEFEDETVATVEADEYTQNESKEDLIGVGGKHAYRIAGLKTGTTELIFRYMRSWEGEESAIETVIYDIEVNENNELAIIGERH